MEKVVSIIVPVYNTEKYLDQCIQSILAQTYTNWELLLIDDGSTDSSGVICDKYAAQDDRIRVFHKTNGGVSAARNFGLANAHGVWVMFVDADDTIDHTALEEFLKVVSIHPQCDVVFCDFLMDYGTHRVHYPCHSAMDDKISFLKLYLVTGWASVANIFARRSLYITNGIYFPETISYCEDFHVAVRLCYFSRKIQSLHKPLYIYNRTNTQSALHSRTINATFQEIESNLQIVDFFKRNNEKRVEKELAWRILKSKQELIFHEKFHEDYKTIYPQAARYIIDCPFLTIKSKCLAWFLTHRLSFVVSIYLKLRSCKYAFGLIGHNASQK